MQRRVLITGANGLLGSRVVALLLRRGHVVHGVVRPGARPLPPGALRLECDLSDGRSWDLPPSPLDAVVHLAQPRRHRDFPAAADDMVAVNVLATARLLELARRAGATRFVFASSGGVYAPSALPLAEEDPIQPDAFYLSTKRAGEELVLGYRSVLATTILRPFFIYGPGQREDMLLPRLAQRVLAGEPITLEGQDGLEINPIHVEDAAKAVVGALAGEGHLVANLAGFETISLREVAEVLGRAVGASPILQPTGGVQRRLIGKTDRTRALMGEDAHVSLRAGIAEVARERAARPSSQDSLEVALGPPE